MLLCWEHFSGKGESGLKKKNCIKLMVQKMDMIVGELIYKRKTFAHIFLAYNSIGCTAWRCFTWIGHVSIQPPFGSSNLSLSTCLWEVLISKPMSSSPVIPERSPCDSQLQCLNGNWWIQFATAAGTTITKRLPLNRGAVTYWSKRVVVALVGQKIFFITQAQLERYQKVILGANWGLSHSMTEDVIFIVS